MDNKLWFKRKLYGWGWTPSTKEGWFVIVAWLILLILGTRNIEEESWQNLIFIVFITAILIYICYKKGEKPRWQWGDKTSQK